ncbi:MAG: Ada metal-binding domain-containing protein [Blastococcus sp.]
MTALRATVFRLIGPDGREHPSDRLGTVGGHRRSRIYGRLDCPSALRALARGGYRAHRVFFADEITAIQAGYRPCGACLPEQYRAWKRALADGGSRKRSARPERLTIPPPTSTSAIAQPDIPRSAGAASSP